MFEWLSLSRQRPTSLCADLRATNQDQGLEAIPRRPHRFDNCEAAP
jgi:hypothetical protein